MSEFKRVKTSEEILEFLDNVDVSDDEPTNIIIILPDVDCLTDEENVDDNAIVINDDTNVLSSDICDTFEILNHNFEIAGTSNVDSQPPENPKMVPYFGRHSCKMVTYFSFHLMVVLVGTKRIEGSPLGSEVVFNLLESVENPNLHKVFFDIFFTSYSLTAMLKEKGFFATGTVRENRIGNCKLKSVKLLGKECKGIFDFAFKIKNEICAVRWNDNSVVTKRKKTVNVQQPNVIQDYNKNMGGVNLHDNAIENYRIRVKGKNGGGHFLATQSKLVLSLLKSSSDKSNEVTINESAVSITNTNLGQPSKNALPTAIRKYDIGHLIIRKNVRRRCRNCQSQTIYLCIKCNVFLHPDCFQEFHEK
ncbi:piggyBac transposable element-derived protein 3-like [Aphis gossypii]|uniref:piggyBac transposable element-derived protein 3-like n=1 Tax=Aphis gossypii TaxID=80765 RepID=UPI002159589C|nr:piggyBac transposable element-derived protein 3-like [Aphis gossypii]